MQKPLQLPPQPVLQEPLQPVVHWVEQDPTQVVLQVVLQALVQASTQWLTDSFLQDCSIDGAATAITASPKIGNAFFCRFFEELSSVFKFVFHRLLFYFVNWLSDMGWVCAKMSTSIPATCHAGASTTPRTTFFAGFIASPSTTTWTCVLTWIIASGLLVFYGFSN